MCVYCMQPTESPRRGVAARTHLIRCKEERLDDQRANVLRREEDLQARGRDWHHHLLEVAHLPTKHAHARSHAAQRHAHRRTPGPLDAEQEACARPPDTRRAASWIDHITAVAGRDRTYGQLRSPSLASPVGTPVPVPTALPPARTRHQRPQRVTSRAACTCAARSVIALLADASTL